MHAADATDTQIDGILKRMTIEEKVGQCFTYLWSGHLITPSVVGAIERLHCGGLRLQPAFLSGKRHKYYRFDTQAGAYDYPPGYEPIPETLLSPGGLGNIDPEPYAERINRLQCIAGESGAGIPLNMTIDQEGDLSRNYPYGGMHLFPSAMGQTASGDPSFVYEVNKAVARQLSAMGVNCIHSPVLDVNINPQNPEIGIRSYGDDPDVVAEYGAAAMRGMQDGGLTTTAKHFPGRGDSASDAHFETPALDADRARLDSVELLPFRRLIAAGLDCVMIAHNVYTALDPGVIATVSKRIVTDLLRGELGFEEVVTTDAIAMQALMKIYPLPEACARALQAGADLVLNKTETAYRDQGFLEALRFVREGLISEEDLDRKVRRILRMKWKRGLFAHKGIVDPSRAADPIRDPVTAQLSREAARRAAIVLRDKAGLLPLTPGQKVLVIEQRLQDVFYSLDLPCHRLTFTEAMLNHSLNVTPVDTQFHATEADEEIVLPLAAAADVVVMTNDYLRGEENNSALIHKLLAAGARLIVVANTPYELSIPSGVQTAVCTFSSTPESQRVAAAILYGNETAGGRWPLLRTAQS